MEIWLDSLENMEKGKYYEKGDNEPANIVFCIDVRGIINTSDFNAVKDDIIDLSEKMFDDYSDIKVYVYYQTVSDDYYATHNLLTDSETDNDYFTDIEQLSVSLGGLSTYLAICDFWSYDFVEATNYVVDVCDDEIIAIYHITAETRVMGDIDGAGELSDTILNDERIFVSLLCPYGTNGAEEFAFVSVFSAESGGIVYPGGDSASCIAAIEDNIADVFSGNTDGNYYALSSLGLTQIKLERALHLTSAVDTDKDGIRDWEEVDIVSMSNILSANGRTLNISDNIKIKTSDLPTLQESLVYYQD
jgi:hypothetical protein